MITNYSSFEGAWIYKIRLDHWIHNGREGYFYILSSLSDSNNLQPKFGDTLTDTAEFNIQQ